MRQLFALMILTFSFSTFANSIKAVQGTASVGETVGILTYEPFVKSSCHMFDIGILSSLDVEEYRGMARYAYLATHSLVSRGDFLKLDKPIESKEISEFSSKRLVKLAKDGYMGLKIGDSVCIDGIQTEVKLLFEGAMVTDDSLSMTDYFSSCKEVRGKLWVRDKDDNIRVYKLHL